MSGAVAVPEARTRQLADAVPEMVFFAGVFIATAALAAANGGYFPSSWRFGTAPISVPNRSVSCST